MQAAAPRVHLDCLGGAGGYQVVPSSESCGWFGKYARRIATQWLNSDALIGYRYFAVKIVMILVLIVLVTILQ
jgi:hypothetical protein